jgi:hypothetical protein
VLALKEKRSKHGSSSLAAERQTTGHEVEGDTEATLPVQAYTNSGTKANLTWLHSRAGGRPG